MGWLAKIFGRQPHKPPAAASPLDTYLGLRSLALDLREKDPAVVGAAPDEPMAILMETSYEGSATVTLVSVADGSASLYFSTGGGIIGGGAHPPVAAAAQAWLEHAVGYAPQMSPTTQFPLPAAGRTRFYLIFAGRVLTAEAAEDDLGYERHALSPLFHLGQVVIEQIRLHSPQ